MEIMKIIKECISQNINIGVEDIGDTAHLQNDLFADSLDMLRIRLSVEEKLGIQFNQDEIVKCISVDEIYRLALRKREASV